MTMIDKVAEEIHAKAYETRDSSRMPDWRAVAAAAIQAMRDPPDEVMTNCDNDTSGDPYCVDHHFLREQWNAMIDAALANA